MLQIAQGHVWNNLFRIKQAYLSWHTKLCGDPRNQVIKDRHIASFATSNGLALIHTWRQGGLEQCIAWRRTTLNMTRSPKRSLQGLRSDNLFSHRPVQHTYSKPGPGREMPNMVTGSYSYWYVLWNMYCRQLECILWPLVVRTTCSSWSPVLPVVTRAYIVNFTYWIMWEIWTRYRLLLPESWEP